MFLGNYRTPDFSGNGQYSVMAPFDGAVAGSVAKRAFAGGPSQLTVTYTPPALSALTLHLHGVQVAVDLTETGCKGRIGGAIPMSDVLGTILPTVIAYFNWHMSYDYCRYYDASCTPAERVLLALLDTNHDRTISVDEVTANSLVQSFLVPDVDVLDRDGNPGHDDMNDSMSVAFGFTCVGAQFTE
jgi:hypothetical protein